MCMYRVAPKIGTILKIELKIEAKFRTFTSLPLKNQRKGGQDVFKSKFHVSQVYVWHGATARGWEIQPIFLASLRGRKGSNFVWVTSQS